MKKDPLENTELPETLYSSEASLNSPFRLVREMMCDLRASKELAWRLFIRNISAQYRQSFLGYIWAFLPPLASMVVWVMLNSQNIININDPGMPYPVFVLTGTVLWQAFIDAVNSPLKVVNDSQTMLAKINFPREALILAGLYEVLFNFVIRLVLLAGIFMWFGVSLPATIGLSFVGIMMLICLGLMVGILLTPLSVLYGDVGRSVAIFLQFWFFLTPVVYPMPELGAMALIAKYNPVTPLLVTSREWMILGEATQLPGFLTVSLIALASLLFGWLVLRLAMPHLIARISA